MTWWYLSFVDDDGKFLGAGYSEGDDAAAAQKTATFAPSEFMEVMLIGPLKPGELEENVPPELRGVLIPPGHDHLADTSADTSEMIALAIESGYEGHAHGPLE